MAHDPKREDYERLSLRYALALDTSDPSAATHAFATFGRRFAQDRDSLPQSDADRAFHLVALATETIDYRLPLASEEQAEALVRRGRDLLEEALSLDEHCFDAVRMLSASRLASVDERYQFLASRVDEVRDVCEEERERASEALGGERAALGALLSLRPYWRWLASMAEDALICGRNHDAIAAAERLLESDSRDLSDVRFTLAYALAKLEDERGLEELARRYETISPMRSADDAWLILSRCALAHKRCDFAGARNQLRHLLDVYPGCAGILIRQIELPDGEFARLRVQPYGEDELILAVSEGMVLLQEGNDRSGRGVFGMWVMREAARLDPAAAAEAVRAAARGEGARP
ncbi:response regulator receiver protein [Olsenella profusa]|uniref:Response regulator receiver protein n=1 Tax=Olsenella profusa TaxID=138595 RepID=A0ABS2F3I8_9ACTN|nr:response regulator receiver protein [Olsenella profusa]MBM6775393.1 response regulator receiver protein [Olsenella profusa]